MTSDFQYEEGVEWRLRLTADLKLHFPQFDFGRHSFRDDFDREWLALHGHSLVIRTGYASNGASPKFRMFGRWIGTPDPEASRMATVVHDALYQFINVPCFPLTRAQCDEIFFHIMEDSGFRCSALYYRAVRTFGWLFASTKDPSVLCDSRGH